MKKHMKKYIFNCSRESVISIIEEGEMCKIIEDWIRVDIKIKGYSDLREDLLVTKKQFDKILIALQNETTDIFKVRYDVGLLSAYNTQKSNMVIINGCMYIDNGYKPHEKSIFLGYAGRKFKYKKIDSGEEVLTNDMWNGTKLSDLIVEFMPDNAVWN